MARSKSTWKDKLSLSNIFTGALIIFTLAMLFSSDFKGLVIQNLMKVGLFQPDVPDGTAGEAMNDSGRDELVRDIVFKNPDEKAVRLSDLKGKVVFINFWATWCPPCIAEMPTINKLYAEMGGDKRMAFMMVDVDNNRVKSQAFMDKKNFDLPLYTPGGPIPSSYMSGTIPTTLVLDKMGKVVFRHEGAADFSNGEFRAFLQKLAAE